MQLTKAEIYKLKILSSIHNVQICAFKNEYYCLKSKFSQATFAAQCLLINEILVYFEYFALRN